MSSSVVRYHTAGSKDVAQPRGSAEEEWVTTKKVEIVTTKNVERKIQRQVVLEDGRVVEEEIPTVTVDTTEDKQTFETDQDEERNLEGEGNSRLSSRFDTSGGVLVGDKFTSVKKINDVRENLVKTEAMQNLGGIRTRDVTKVLQDRDDIRKYLRSRDGPDKQVSVAPRTVFTSNNHRVVTDKENVQERNWVNKGKMQNERIKTEEHIEYNSDDSPDDGSSSSSSKSSHHKLEPEIYKTRKDENFTEYFKISKDDNNKSQTIKVGDGPHYVSESKEVEREDDNRLSHQNFRPSQPKQIPRHLLAEVDANARTNKKPVNRTDSWLEKHFGSTSSLSGSSVELRVSRPGSREGYGLRRSNSICDIRRVDNSNNDFYATVRQSGKVPEVKMREKKHSNSYAENRMSANFSSSGHPVRPPRRTKKSEYEEFSHSLSSKKPDPIYSSVKQSDPPSNRSQSAQVTEKYYFGNPVTVKKAPKASQPSGGLNRSYSSVQNLHKRSIPRGHYQSTGNIYQATMGRNNEPDHIVSNSSSTSKHRRPGDNDQTKSSSGDVYQLKNRSGNYYSSSQRQMKKEKDIHSSGERQVKVDRYKQESSHSQPYSDTVHSVSKQTRRVKAGDIYATPHRIIYSTESPVGSPSTKYRTKIVINGETG